MKLFLPLLLITQCVAVCLSSANTECILDSSHGNGPALHCSSSYAVNKMCLVLDEMNTLQHDLNDTTVILCSQNFSLDFNLVLQGVRNIQLVGSPSTLTCSGDAGLTVLESENVTITNVTFEKCGALHNSTTIDRTKQDSSVHMFRSAVYISNSTDITLDNVSITNSNGIGLSFFDTDGSVEIKNSNFSNNRVDANESSTLPGGGGVYVEFTYCQQYGESCDRFIRNSNSSYHFDDCKFIDNSASSVNRHNTDFAINEGSKFHGLGRGGGLNVLFRGKAAHNRVELNRCRFKNNSAIWGGGLKVIFLDEVYGNTFTAQECVLEKNVCSKRGGGGADVGYIYFLPHSIYPRENKVNFSNCNFTDNQALFGGGLAFFSSSGTLENLNNSATFGGCKWTHNRARFGSAVDVSTHSWKTSVNMGYLPTLQFRDSLFWENYVINIGRQHDLYSFYKRGNGAFLSTELTISFAGTVNFTNNNGSALFLISSVAVFQPHTHALFHNNSGFNGGAIAVIGFSYLTLNNDMSIILTNNSAVRCGGAIYSYSIDKHDYVSSRSCFINSERVYSNEYLLNTSVVFENNSAGQVGSGASTYHCGHAIFATTLLPCFYACTKNTSTEKVDREETFACYGNFTFNEREGADGYEVMTSGANFMPNCDNTTQLLPIKVIPNKKEALPVTLLDNLQQRVNADVFIDATEDSRSLHKVEVERSYTYLSDNRTVVYGYPGDTAYITLTKMSTPQNIISLKLEVQQCPPGFVNLNAKCICSVGTKSFYSPVYACDNDEFVAKARHGYWIGYVGGETEDHLMYSYCPNRQCFHSLAPQHSHSLTHSASKDLLNQLVCGNESTDILCGSCQEGYSASYHSSDTGLCTNKDCKLGWLFYFVSELLPITIFFVIVIVFNISFMTGDLNGFVFFAQMLDSVSVSAQGFVFLSNSSLRALTVARLLYRFFNFDFFRLNELSFCLWRGATTLDMLAFVYVTMAYALLLILATIWLMNKCNLYQRIHCLRASTMRASITHGLSAFLVMVYVQCATVSFNILEFTTLYTKGHTHNITVVTYQGNIPYFDHKHLPYAIPALFCVITIVLIPTIILLLYPSCFKVIDFLRLGEVKHVSSVLQKIPHSVLNPFADSFQSCFKDEMRFFAGIYFVYRLALLLLWMVPILKMQRFMLLELLFVIMLFIHSICQPYKRKWHNVLDALVFVNLLLINGITAYNFHYTEKDIAQKIGTDTFIHMQLILVYLPLAYFVIYTVVCIIVKIRRIRKVKSSSLAIQLRQLMKMAGSEEELPSRLEQNDQESDDEVNDYQLYEEQAAAKATY